MLHGFDPKFRDFPEYILGITHEIWEERGVETLNHYYSDDIIVRSPTGVVVGNKAVIDATWATLEEFPDRQLLGEDVIWSGDDESGFLSSHRIFSTATHQADGIYGEASNTRLQYRVIADCAAKNNQIYDEWLIRDQGAIVRQLGLDPRQYAVDQIEAEGGPGTAQPVLTPATDIAGPYVATGNDDPLGGRYRDILRGALAGDAAVAAQYDRACQVEHPGGFTHHGREAAVAVWSDLGEAFPSADFQVHHQIGRTDEGLGPRAALRWSLDGTHDGDGVFGAATGAPVHVMGISHAEFGPWGLRREWVLFDETSIWKQILMHTG